MAEAAVLAVVTALAPTVVELLIKSAGHLASSSKPSWGTVSTDIEKIKEQFETIKSHLSLADRWEEHDEQVKEWVWKVRGVAQQTEDILDDFAHDSFSGAGGGAVAFLHSVKHGSTRRKAADELAARLEAIRPKVERICNIHDTLLLRKLKRLQTPPAVLQRCLYNDLDPRRPERKELRGLIAQELAETSRAATSVAQQSLYITVAGASGQGKTTLVRKIYDDLQESNLFDRRAWVAVSGITDELELLRDLAVQLCEENDSDSFANQDELVRKVQSALQERRFIIVFDDVRADDFWSKIENWFSVGHDRRSRILLTTRNDSVAASCSRDHGRVLTIGPLSDSAAWSLFCSRSFGPDATPPSDLEDTGQEIVKRCNGLLLAIVAVANVMSTKERSVNAWNMTYETLKLDLHRQPASSDSILMHRYYELPKHLKRCFMYCAMFPAGRLIKRKLLVRLWVAEGFIQEEGHRKTADELAESYLKELIELEMIIMERQNESGRVKACRMHDSYRKVMLEISSAQNFLMVHDGSEGALAIGNSTRRLSLHNVVGATNLTNKDDSARLRSLLLFRSARISNPSQTFLSWRYRLLRVLDLSDVPITSVPNWIFEMYNLRYLGLRNTKICMKEFPKDIDKLQQLRTLDLWKTEVKSLPRNIIKLENLEHLMFFHTINPHMKYHNPLWFRGWHVPKHMWYMKNLQTLKIIAATDELVDNLGHLANLRTLSITDVTTEQCRPLFETLRKMGHLRRLVVRAKEHNRFMFSTAGAGSSTPPFPGLQKLQLHGGFATCPWWFRELKNLTHLYLFGSRLADDQKLLDQLQSLPKLALLVLDNAYVGTKLVFGPRSFPSLRILIMDELPANSVIADGGALPHLRKLYVRGCKNLRGGSWRGMENLAALREIVLRDHAKELEDFLRPVCSRRNMRLTIAAPKLS